ACALCLYQRIAPAGAGSGADRARSAELVRMLIPFDRPLLGGRLVRRYKRFLADVVLDDGRELTLHCPNTGSMKNCGEPGSRVWIDLHQRPGRKLPGTWELVETAPGELACVHSARANAVVAAALAESLITPLAGYPDRKST